MKKIIVNFLPTRWVDVLRILNNRHRFRQRFGRLQAQVRSRLYGAKAPVVLTGPFRGMNYLNAIVWASITPKWIGSYECELHDVIEEIISSEYATIIDVGSAEGYYAVGLAYRMPQANIHAFDTDFISRSQTQQLARLNGVESRVKVRSYCSHRDIPHSKVASCLISDIEGGERLLLDPVGCPALREYDILVEVHEVEEKPATLDLLTTRFSESHDIREIISVDRMAWINGGGGELLATLNSQLQVQATDETRPMGQKWLWMKAKN